MYLTRIHLRFFLILLALFCQSLPAQVQPWEGEPFQASPQEILLAYRQLNPPADSKAWYLLRSFSTALDEEGRITRSEHEVYAVLEQSAVDVFSVVETGYQPWHQKTPTIRARVITPDGVERQLDPSTIADTPAHENSSQIFNDSRVLRAPLPGVAPGSIVEVLTEVAESRPAFAQGTQRSIHLHAYHPVRRARAEISYPKQVPLRYRLYQFPQLKDERQEGEDRTRLLFEAESLDPVEYPEPYLPPEHSRYPVIVFSTGQSWHDLARSYHQIIEKQIADLPSHSLLEQAAASDQRQLIEQIRQAVSAKVRYTGIEFGESSIVPWTPRETVERQYGDCKDQATLLVSELRRHQIPAWVALLRTGPDFDVVPELPGLGRFDHAIVYVGGEADLWIDPTDPFSRAGHLPPPDEGRWALIASPESDDLVKTPASSGDDNREEIFLEYHLSDLGKGRAREVTVYRGSRESEMRRLMDDYSAEEEREMLESYGESAFASQDLSYQFSDPRDFSQPFRLQLEMAQAGTIVTSRQDAAVSIGLSELYDHLPMSLRRIGDDEKEEGRQDELVLHPPVSAEVRITVHIPPGFEPAELPATLDEQWGEAASFRRSFSLDGEQTLTGQVALRLHKRRLSPEDVAEFRKGFQEMEDQLLLQFHQRGETLLAGGEVKEALAEFRSLIEAQPDNGLHRARVANALITVGLGDAARREIAEAVELSPDVAHVHAIRSTVFQHDLVGRHMTGQFDLAQALDGAREAARLAPDDANLTVMEPILMSYNEQGVQFGEGVDARAFLEASLAWKEEFDNSTLDGNIYIGHLMTGRFEELRDLLEGDDSLLGRSYWLTALAKIEGVPAAAAKAQRVLPNSEERQQVFHTAANRLLLIRSYPEAAEMYRILATASAEPASVLGLVQGLRRTERGEDMALPPQEPESVIKKLILASRRDQLEQDVAAQLISPSSRELETAIKGTTDTFRQVIQSMAKQMQTLPQVAADFVVSFAQFARRGDPEIGFRLQNLTAAQGSQGTICVSRYQDTYMIVLGTDPINAMGREALYRLQQGEFEVAKQWLKWALEELPKDSKVRSLVEDEDDLDRRQARALALALAAGDPPLPSEWVLEGLQELLREDAWTPQQRNVLSRYATAQLAVLERWQEVLDSFSEDAYSGDEEDQGRRVKVAALRALGRFEEGHALIEEALQADPRDADLLRISATLYMHEGKFEEALRIHRQIIERGDAVAGDFNNLAWLKLVQGEVDQEALNWGQRAVQGGGNYASLHTLASLYADQGAVSEAHSLLLQARDKDFLRDLAPSDWFVLGQIAEHLDLPQVARDYYSKVEQEDEISAVSTYRLAQRRLQALSTE
ncbi:MAG TPA: DUF3857 domain-containing protein [Acidobacteriota bacterium]|nr:DUF3857 domain-containing protein [Acidobacteriota bacterium]